jgi:mono/diheme cytochrome c family protein
MKMIKKRYWILGALMLMWGWPLASEPRADPGMDFQLVATGDCPQVRKTPEAPKTARNRANPLKRTGENIKAGQRLFQNALPLACKLCHGEQGNGQGDPDFESTPTSRNFTCVPTMNALSDGQLFWIIRNGSPNTAMFGYSDLSEEDVWRLVHYLRGFSKSK